jgi:hypothetical protein
VSEPPDLERPDEVVLGLVRRLGAIGEPKEVTYLRSGNASHRWGRDSFDGLEEEFRFKATWVAQQLRERFGSPDHQAFVALAESRLTGVRAAAWRFGAVVGYVSLRKQGGKRLSFKVVLGAMRPLPPSPPGPEGLDARDAVWATVSQLVH